MNWWPEAFPCRAAYAAVGLATRDYIPAAPAQLPPPVQLGIWDPKLLAQIKAAMQLLTTAAKLLP
ncbi:hypothetical protein QJQ45_029281, partial [Haematococcus lacustris]